jgi:CRISPR-associated protein Cas2
MNRGGLYLAVYDVTEDRERTKVADILECYGVRIQKSAFEVRLSKGHRSRLLGEFKALNLESGWVAIYRVDEGARRHTAGLAPENPLAEEHHGYVL